METLTKKEKNTVPTVEKSTKPEEPSETVSSEQPQEAPVISLKDFDPKKVAMAEEMGIPIKKLVDWVNVTEVRLQILAKSMPNQEQMTKAMEQVIQNAQQRQREAYAKAVKDGTIPQGGGQQAMGLIQMLAPLMAGGGGGSDSEFAKIGKDLVIARIDQIKAETSILTTLGKEVLSRVFAKGVKEVVTEVT